MQNSGKLRFIIMLLFVGFSVVSYFFKSQVNPVTGEKQRVDLTPEEEVAMGLQSAPEMAAQFGGLYPDDNMQLKVQSIGQRLLNATEAKNSPYQFHYYVLADPETINAFALPGGQIFITMGLLKRLQNEDQLAGVLGHEMGHVINRHSSEQMAKQGLMNGIVQGVAMGSGDMNTAQVAAYVSNVIGLKYGREDELESDSYGIKYMYQAGYDPNQMLGVMEILNEASGGRQEDFMSSHPSPENRMIKIKEEIAKLKSKSLTQ